MSDTNNNVQNTQDKNISEQTNANEVPCAVSQDDLNKDIEIKDLRGELALETLAPANDENVVAADENAEGIDGKDYVQIEEKSDDNIEAPSEQTLTSADEDATAAAEIEPAAGEEEAEAQNISEATINDSNIAERLAAVEPAAGTQAQGGISSGRGYGFQSSFDAQGVISLDDIGPINPTELQYGIEYNRDEYFLGEEGGAEALPALNPILDIADQQVYEDGSVKLAAFVSPESANGTLTITISGIPAGWTVSDDAFDAADLSIGTGVFDAVSGTWAITVVGGVDFDGGPIFTPPADSDVDALDLEFSVVENDPTTGQSGSVVEEFDIIVDAVADAPDVDAQDDSGNEGATLDIDVSALTGEEVNNGAGLDDGSEHIVSYEISGVPAGFTLSAGTETAPGSGVYTLTPAEIVGLTITPNDPNFSGSINLTATAFTTENAVTDIDFDFGNNDNQATDSFTLTWNPVADAPKLVVDNAFVKEDSSVFVPVEAELADTDGSEFLTITVNGIPSDWDLTGAGWTQTGPNTFEITVPAGDNYNGGFTLTPPADSDVDLTGITVTATSTETANSDSASVSENISVFVDAVYDDADVDGLDNSGLENTALDVDITGAAGDTDGSETIVKYEISDVPAGFVFNQGTDLGGGVWEFTPAELVGLQITPPTDYVGDIDVKVTIFTTENPGDVEVDSSDNTTTADDIFNLEWKPESNPPCVKVNQGVDNAVVKEDGSVEVPIIANLDPSGSGNEILTVTVTGIDSSWGFSAPVGTYTPATGTWTITLPAGTNLSTVFTFTPPADSDVDLTGLQATASAYEPASDTTAYATPDDFNIIVDAVADAPEIDAQDDSGSEGTPLDIDVSALTGEEVNNGAGLDDGSEHIVSYEISGVPAGFTLSAGTETAPGSGVYTLTAAEIVGLTITPNDPNFSGSINLTATVFTTENPASDAEFDLSDNNNQASDQFVLTWTPEIDPPCVKVNNGIEDVIVKEDGSVEVPITAQLSADAAPSEFLTVTVTGIDPAWGSFSAPIGTYTPATGTWTITLPAGAALNTVFTFVPNADEDIDLSGLVATAVATDPVEGINAQASDNFNIITDAVADVPNLDAVNKVTGEEGTTIPLTITTSVNDTDGSEVIEVIKITNLPAGATLTAGTYDPVNDVWELSPADLIGLGVVVPDGVIGKFTINVESVAYEQNTSGNEVDLTDNRASAFDTIDVCVTEDDEPVVDGDTVVVDETDLAPTTSASGSVVADFGTDNPGHINGNGTYNIGSLTSGGVAVSVNFDASTNTYTGTAGGEDIFTLVIQDNGDFTFTLQGVIDHPDTTDHNDMLPLQFGVTATDSDGDHADATITVNVYDDGLTANDDFIQTYVDEGAVTGNVVDNDDLSNDEPNLVTQVKLGTTVYDVPADGSDIVIDGEYGTLTINNTGAYSYLPSGNGLDTTYTFTKSNPAGSDAGGDIKNVDTSFNETTNEFTFTLTVEDVSQGFTLALNGGPNPKGHEAEMALFYFDATGLVPVISVYAYNGMNTQTSWSDGSKAAGVQDADKILNSIANADVFSNISVTTDADGNNVFSFTMDATDVLNHDPLYGPDGDWTGVSFGEQIGMWLHPVQGLGTSYDSDGYLTQWSSEGQSWYDTSCQDTEVTITKCVEDVFEYTLTDGDFDTDSAVLTFKTCESRSDLIVGRNVDDTDTSDVPHLVNGDEGVIDGGYGADILVGDAGGSFLEPQTQDYNFVFILDVSGSMGSPSNANSRVSLLFDAVENLLADVAAYGSGDVKVHFVPFSTTSLSTGTFDFSNPDVLSDISAYLQSIVTDGYTNYESPMQKAIEWLEGAEPLGGNAITTTYFISDGQPNRYVNNSGSVATGNAATVMDQITGSDGTNEVQQLQDLSDEVVAVGINIGSSISNLDVIDSDGNAMNLDDPTDLSVALAETSPLDKLFAAGGDDIQGGDGDDIIFGDVLFTDDLATLHGLSVDGGSGWEVFERLENGESALNASWDRDDTIAYIRANAEALAEESVNSQGDERDGGDDVISGGAGDDLIFGQEGDDVIFGGEGNDVIFGGSGADLFVFEAITDGLDTIKDFDVSEGDQLDISSILSGFDPINDNIADFVTTTEVGGNTIVSVDIDGSASAASPVDLVVLEGVTGFDVNTSLVA